MVELKNIEAPSVETKKAIAEAGTKEEKSPAQIVKKAVAAKKATEKKSMTPVTEKQKEKPSSVKESAKDSKPINKPISKASAPKKALKKSTKSVEKEKVQEVFLEYAGRQLLTSDVVSQIEEAYKAEGHRISSIKSLRVYISPEESKAYYVINDKADGKFVEI